MDQCRYPVFEDGIGFRYFSVLLKVSSVFSIGISKYRYRYSVFFHVCIKSSACVGYVCGRLLHCRTSAIARNGQETLKLETETLTSRDRDRDRDETFKFRGETFVALET